MNGIYGFLDIKIEQNYLQVLYNVPNFPDFPYSPESAIHAVFISNVPFDKSFDAKRFKRGKLICPYPTAQVHFLGASQDTLFFHKY